MLAALRFLFGPAVALIAGLLGWVVGSIYPAPAPVTETFNREASELRDRLSASKLNWGRLEALLSPEQMQRFEADAAKAMQATGDLIVVERGDDATLEENMQMGADAAAELASASSQTTVRPPPATFGSFETSLSLCPRMTVSNAPRADAERKVVDYRPLVNVEGVTLAVNPTHGACLSSGFGPRGGRVHKGLDFHAATGGPIAAAGAGTIVEKKYRNDYGNMLIIDHGSGVYTRYAHLSAFADGIAVGTQVRAGQTIALMGNTASYPIPIHLQYELLLGDYNTQRGSFGLTPRSPFDFPRAG
jgi:murein DD-endopeptidase MepM/ murein hydrolase activator NlpD